MGVFNSNVDYNKYKVFYAVAECKSFSKATEYLHISQPAISYAIKELEEQLNVKLFIRNNKTVSLTEDGEKLLYYVNKAFNNIAFGEDLLKERKDDLTGIIRIGIYSHISLFMLPKVMKEFTLKYPNAKFYVYSTSNQEMIAKLKSNELDFIILQYPIFINDNTYTEEVIGEFNTCFYATEYYYNKYIEDNSVISEIPIVLPMRGYKDINGLEEILKKENISLKNNFTSYTTELGIELVKQGAGISWGVKKCIEKELENKELYELPVSFPIPKTKFSIAYNSNILNKTNITFIKYFKEEIKKMSD